MIRASSAQHVAPGGIMCLMEGHHNTDGEVGWNEHNRHGQRKMLSPCTGVMVGARGTSSGGEKGKA